MRAKATKIKITQTLPQEYTYTETMEGTDRQYGVVEKGKSGAKRPQQEMRNVNFGEFY